MEKERSEEPMSRKGSPIFDTLEVDSLALEMARAYRQMATFYRDQLQLSGPEADARARGADNSPDEAAADLARIQDRPPDQIGWFDLTRLTERDPQQAAEEWQRIRTLAQNELASGHRTARALEWHGRPWKRARFLAVRDSFWGSNPPQNGIEASLIDSAAEAFSDYLEWSEHYHMLAGTDAEANRDRLERNGRWKPSHVSVAESLERSARMAKRAHKRFLQTVKILHEVQRSAPTLYVAKADQINVGQQQVNMSASAQEPPGNVEDLLESSALDGSS